MRETRRRAVEYTFISFTSLSVTLSSLCPFCLSPPDSPPRDEGPRPSKTPQGENLSCLEKENEIENLAEGPARWLTKGRKSRHNFFSPFSLSLSLFISSTPPPLFSLSMKKANASEVASPTGRLSLSLPQTLVKNSVNGSQKDF